jgi:hypothetical protein
VNQEYKLHCVVKPFEFEMSDIWAGDERLPDFVLREVIAEDFLAFIEDMGGLEAFLSHCHFRWQKK